VIWCSNDYLGMGQHPKVVGAIGSRPPRGSATGAGGTPQQHRRPPIIRWCSSSRKLADLHGKQAALLFTLGLCLEPDRHCDHRQADFRIA